MLPLSQETSSRWTHLFVLFFLSGISGLIYESLWSRYIRQFVGSAATAQILVLALFMGGMSLGALICARLVPRIKSPVFVYGVVEGLVGLYAIAFPWLQSAAVRLCYDVLFPAVGAGSGIAVVKWTVAGLLILPPCVLLGMTFPLMSVGILRRDRERSGEILSALYFTNSLGASLGAVVAGFLLVPNVGLPSTLLTAAALNLLIMVVALRERQHGEAPPIEETPASAGMAGRAALVFLLVAFGTGLSSFMYEIGWIRLLSMVLGSATHSFEVMLSAFIFGMACGGFWVRKRMDRFEQPEVVLAIVQLVMGLSAVATLPAYRLTVYAVSMITRPEVRDLTDWYFFNIVRYLLCLLVMFPATFCAGMTLPLLTHVLLRRGHAEGVVGKIYGVNTLGAITGAVAAGLVLLPLIGLRLVIVGGALIDMALAVALLLLVGKGRLFVPAIGLKQSLALGLAVVWTVVGSILFPVDPVVLTSTVFRHGRTRLQDYYRIISYVDGRTASVTTVERLDQPGYRIIYTNGKPDASVKLERWPEGRARRLGPAIAGDEPNQFLVGMLPYTARPAATDVAIIGFGSGVSVHTLLGSPTVRRVDTIEIEPYMVEGAKVFHPANRRAYEDPRSHIWYDDAKAYFASAGGRYDFIVSEPTNPWVSGVASLFTIEFYKETKRYLKPNGLLCQWIQGYELSDELFVTVLAAVDREFSDFLILRVGARDWLIMATPDGTVGEFNTDLLSWPDMQEPLDLLGIHEPAQLASLRVANKRLLHPYLANKQPNSDAMPVLDTGAEFARFMRAQADFLYELRAIPAPILPVLAGLPQADYPVAGIGDVRDPHVLHEAERAVTLVKLHENPQTPASTELDLSPMRKWAVFDGLLDSQPSIWPLWMEATYTTYAAIIPYHEVHGTRWWKAVVRRATQDDAPPGVVASVELLDALSRLDGPTIERTAGQLLRGADSPLPRSIVTIAGAIALELRGAPDAERRAWVDRWMADLGNDAGASDERAYRALRAYIGRETPSGP